MTIERPMFPPRAEEHCQIISLVDRQKGRRRISIRGGNPLLEGPAETYSIELEHTAPRVRPPDGISETLKNRNLRDGRKPQWSKAEAAREYWRARLDMESAISTAQRHPAFLKALTILLTLQMIGGRSSLIGVFRSPPSL
jgi:hypothetical protein